MELINARVTAAGTAATDYQGAEYEGLTMGSVMVESMHMTTNNKLMPDGAEPFQVNVTWKAEITVGAILVLARNVQGEFVIIAEACDE